MKRKFDQYFKEGLFRDENEKKMFYSWDLDKIWRESSEWKLDDRWLFLYVLANNCSFRTLHAHVGSTEDFYRRVAQHNGQIPGGPSSTRKAAGNWQVIMYVVVPPYRNYSVKQLVQSCKKGRGWQSR
jgi:hypothetical protein